MICMILGTVLVLAALSLFLWNEQEDKNAGEFAEEALSKVIQRIEVEVVPEASSSIEESFPNPYDPTMKAVEIDGYAYIGYLRIPAVDLELPIMSEWDYERLQIAPCRYSGSTKSNDLILCAHNFVRHFGPIRGLTPGDMIYFTDMDGIIWKYEVESVDIMSSAEMEDILAEDSDLILFTCDYGGVRRVTVRCKYVK